MKESIETVLRDGDAIAAAAQAAAPDVSGESRALALQAVQRGLFGAGAEIDAADELRQSSPGSIVARYVVLEHIGQGGMGAVTRAYDPKLRREVALKRLVSRTSSRDGPARLLREAQAMAQLSHTNVVGVHDVETIGDEIVLVMEYVAGRTLRRWLGERERGWAEIVATFRDAGAGLVAAHRVGIVHRDFKPSNVLIADDGTVKVTDFGLAKAVGMAEHSTGSDPSTSDFVDELASPLTRADSVLGTPRYMAPEQHGGITDARVDQYAFCVALWEALCNKPPFEARTLDELAHDKQAGPPPWSGPRIPAPIIAAIRRGLDADPLRRWPDVQALLDALDRPRRRFTVLAGAAVVGLVAASAFAMRAVDEANEVCTGARGRIEGAWNEESRDGVRHAFARTQTIYARDAAEGVIAALDGWASAWVHAHEDACEATAVRAEQSSDVLDLRMACLQRAQRELEVVARTLMNADGDVVEHAGALVGGLPAVDRCANVDLLRADVRLPDDPAVAAAVDDAHVGLVHAGALRRAGQLDAARNIVDAWTPAAVALGYAPLRAEVELEDGRVLEGLGHYARAESRLRSALTAALASGAWSLAAETAGTLAVDLGVWQGRRGDGRWAGELGVSLAEGASVDDDALAFALLARAKVAEAAGDFADAEADARRGLDLRRARRGEDDPVVASTEVMLGTILERLGRFEEAETHVRRAVDVLSAALAPEHPDVTSAKNVLGIIQLSRGRFAEAEAFYRTAIEQWTRSLGPDHLLVAHATANLGLALHNQGRFDEAEAHHRQALARREKELGGAHPLTLASLNNLGMTLQAQGRLDDAQSVAARVLAMREETFGSDHLDTASARNNLGIVQLDRGDNEGAEASFRRTLEAWRRHLGDEHPIVGSGYNNLGLALVAQGRVAEAEAAYRSALAIGEAKLAPDHLNLGRVLYNLGALLVDRGAVDEARPLLERAWSIRSEKDGEPLRRAETAFALARAIADTDRLRSDELVERARRELAEIPEQGDDLRVAIARWSKRR